jgi:DNA-binding NarL/FixJ family response regulator
MEEFAVALDDREDVTTDAGDGPVGRAVAPRARVVAAQPEGLMLEALTGMLEAAGFDVVGRCTCRTQLPACLAAHSPDIALVDERFDGDSIIEARRALPNGRLVLLASTVDPVLARETLELDVDAVLLKTTSWADVAGALERVLAGDAVFPAGWLRAARQCEPSSPVPALSPRQHEVLELLSEGLSNDLIADRLFISTNTVKFHIAGIYSRLGVRNRVEAARALSELQTPGS